MGIKGKIKNGVINYKTKTNYTELEIWAPLPPSSSNNDHQSKCEVGGGTRTKHPEINLSGCFTENMNTNVCITNLNKTRTQEII